MAKIEITDVSKNLLTSFISTTGFSLIIYLCYLTWGANGLIGYLVIGWVLSFVLVIIAGITALFLALTQ